MASRWSLYYLRGMLLDLERARAALQVGDHPETVVHSYNAAAAAVRAVLAAQGLPAMRLRDDDAFMVYLPRAEAMGLYGISTVLRRLRSLSSLWSPVVEEAEAKPRWLLLSHREAEEALHAAANVAEAAAGMLRRMGIRL